MYLKDKSFGKGRSIRDTNTERDQLSHNDHNESDCNTFITDIFIWQESSAKSAMKSASLS